MTTRSIHRRLALLAAVLTVASAHTTALGSSPAISRPAGFVRARIPAGEKLLLSLPFDPFSPALDDILAGQLTGGATPSHSDRILLWDAANQRYDIVLKIADPHDRWITDLDTHEPTPILLAPGAAFYVENRQAFEQDVFLAGHLPEALDPLLFLPGLSLFGRPFPALTALDGLIEAGALAGLNPDQADVLTREGTRQRFWLDIVTGRWQAEGARDVQFSLMPGRGYWYERRGADPLTWTPTVPDLSMFGQAGSPRILALSRSAESGAVTLTLTGAGSKRQTLELYRQDLTAGFRRSDGWQVVATRLTVRGNTPVTWQDRSALADEPCERVVAPPNSVVGCLYVVVCADQDRDRDGLPDARELLVTHTDPARHDTDGDGMSDGWEHRHALDPLVADADADQDGDGVSDLQEHQQGTNPRSRMSRRVLYVNARTGNDNHDGLARARNGARGPKKSVQAAFAVAQPGDVVEVAAGSYKGKLSVPPGVKFRPKGKISVH